MADETTTTNPEQTEAPATEATVQNQDVQNDAAQELAAARARIHELNQENEKWRKAKKTAEEQKQIEAGEAKKVAEQRAAERDTAIGERDALQSQIKEAFDILNADIENRVKNWPDEIKDLIPSTEDADALSRMKQVTKLQPLADKLLNQAPRPGNSPGPTSTGDAQENTQVAVSRPAKYYL